MEAMRERYLTNVVNLTRVPLPEIVAQLKELMALESQGWKLRLVDDVVNCMFVFMVQSKTGLAVKVSVPYEYVSDLAEGQKEELNQLWTQQSAVVNKMTAIICDALNPKAEQIQKLQETGVFSGKNC